MGQYLQSIASRYSSRTGLGLYYGVDTELFHPVENQERAELRRKHNLPPENFVIFLSSRISHEKDPETVIQATALARQKGLDAVVINLGGGYQEFLNLARQLVGDDAHSWVLGRPAAHPMGELAEYYQASDCLAQASLAEGLGISPMEALACRIPAVCTAVGGMTHLNGYARLTPKRDPEAMCREFLWLAANREEARRQALQGREYVVKEWNRQKAFADLAAVFQEVMRPARTVARQTA
jgi:mannosyltransferase